MSLFHGMHEGSGDAWRVESRVKGGFRIAAVRTLPDNSQFANRFFGDRKVIVKVGGLSSLRPGHSRLTLSINRLFIPAMPAKKLTRSEIVAMVRSKLPGNPETDEIASLLTSEGIVKNAAFIRAVKQEIVSTKVTPAQLHAILVAKLNPSPSLEDVIRVCDTVPVKRTLNGYRTIHRNLRLSNPEIFEKSEENLFAVRLGSSDMVLFEKFCAMMGMKNSQGFSLLLRAFTLAAGRGQVNLVDLLSRTKRLSRTELQLLSKIFNLDLTGL